MRQAGEPSVDEILDSIKRVIARDNRASSTEQRRVRETSGINPVEGAIGHVAAPRAADNGHVAAEDVLDLGVSARFLDTDEDEGFDDPRFAEAESDSDASLINSHARASMRESLAALAMMAQPGAQPQIVRSGETSLEGLVRELLKPALAEWLDRNLPAMVEEMVAVEISRIVGKR